MGNIPFTIKKKIFKKTKSLTFLNEIFKILSCIRFYDIKHIFNILFKLSLNNQTWRIKVLK